MTDKVQEIMALEDAIDAFDSMGDKPDAQVCPVLWRELRAEMRISAARVALSTLRAEVESQLREVVAPPVPEPILTLTGYQLREALEFVAPDGDADQLESEVCIQHGPERTHDEGTDPAGLYVWLADYPEEGSMPLTGKWFDATTVDAPTEATHTQPASEPVAQSLALTAALDYVKRHAPHFVHSEIRAALTARQTAPAGYSLVSNDLLDNFPEINPSNYNEDDVFELNGWGIEVVLSSKRKPQEQATPQPASEPVANDVRDGLPRLLWDSVQSLNKEEDAGWSPDAHMHLRKINSAVNMMRNQGWFATPQPAAKPAQAHYEEQPDGTVMPVDPADIAQAEPENPLADQHRANSEWAHAGSRDEPAEQRDAWIGGSSYEAAMLRELLANIHRDGGHYVARHGLEKALSDAHKAISNLRCAASPTQQPAAKQEPAPGYCKHCKQYTIEEPLPAQAEPVARDERIWTCKIGGPASTLPHGADAPMRQAVQDAFAQLTGQDAEFCFSGWGGQLTEPERAVVENRLPSAEYEAEWLRKNAPQPAAKPAQAEPGKGRWRKKPVVIDAFCLDGGNRPDWWWDEVSANRIITRSVGTGNPFDDPLTHAEIHTLEGVMRADRGDWIIRGVKGEIYPCKPDIFAATYEAAQSEPVARDGWKLVPVEPTDAMAGRFFDAIEGGPDWDDTPYDDEDKIEAFAEFSKGYRAMLAAAPTKGTE